MCSLRWSPHFVPVTCAEELVVGFRLKNQVKCLEDCVVGSVALDESDQFIQV